jgi:hypothetical protein
VAPSALRRARPGVIRSGRGSGGIFVSEEAAIDRPYNIRLHSTHGVRSRAPRVPALWCIVTPRGASEPNR